MATTFSVIIPVYNSENYTIATLKSIENAIDYFYRNNPLASEFEAEVIIVNDHSTDNTLSLVDNFVRYKKYYKVLNHGSNLGAATARNTGVKLSQGEFLFFCDGDDLFFETHIDYCLRVFEQMENKSQEKLLR
jgi:glycosyltransferase involved in cell wall biosynthesis